MEDRPLRKPRRSSILKSTVGFTGDFGRGFTGDGEGYVTETLPKRVSFSHQMAQVKEFEDTTSSTEGSNQTTWGGDMDLSGADEDYFSSPTTGHQSKPPDSLNQTAVGGDMELSGEDDYFESPETKQSHPHQTLSQTIFGGDMDLTSSQVQRSQRPQKLNQTTCGGDMDLSRDDECAASNEIPPSHPHQTLSHSHTAFGGDMDLTSSQSRRSQHPQKLNQTTCGGDMDLSRDDEYAASNEIPPSHPHQTFSQTTFGGDMDLTSSQSRRSQRPQKFNQTTCGGDMDISRDECVAPQETPSSTSQPLQKLNQTTCGGDMDLTSVQIPKSLSVQKLNQTTFGGDMDVTSSQIRRSQRPQKLNQTACGGDMDISRDDEFIASGETPQPLQKLNQATCGGDMDQTSSQIQRSQRPPKFNQTACGGDMDISRDDEVGETPQLPSQPPQKLCQTQTTCEGDMDQSSLQIPHPRSLQNQTTCGGEMDLTSSPIQQSQHLQKSNQTTCGGDMDLASSQIQRLQRPQKLNQTAIGGDMDISRGDELAVSGEKPPLPSPPTQKLCQTQTTCGGDTNKTSAQIQRKQRPQKLIQTASGGDMDQTPSQTQRTQGPQKLTQMAFGGYKYQSPSQTQRSQRPQKLAQTTCGGDMAIITSSETRQSQAPPQQGQGQLFFVKPNRTEVRNPFMKKSHKESSNSDKLSFGKFGNLKTPKRNRIVDPRIPVANPQVNKVKTVNEEVQTSPNLMTTHHQKVTRDIGLSCTIEVEKKQEPKLKPVTQTISTNTSAISLPSPDRVLVSETYYESGDDDIEERELSAADEENKENFHKSVSETATETNRQISFEYSVTTTAQMTSFVDRKSNKTMENMEMIDDAEASATKSTSTSIQDESNADELEIVPAADEEEEESPIEGDQVPSFAFGNKSELETETEKEIDTHQPEGPPTPVNFQFETPHTFIPPPPPNTREVQVENVNVENKTVENGEEGKSELLVKHAKSPELEHTSALYKAVEAKLLEAPDDSDIYLKFSFQNRLVQDLVKLTEEEWNSIYHNFGSYLGKIYKETVDIHRRIKRGIIRDFNNEGQFIQVNVQKSF